MIKMRITPDGRIQSLWTDDAQLQDLGTLKVRRASHVEFDDQQQCWIVREAQPINNLRHWLQWLFGQPTERVLHRAANRSDALAWEYKHFQPGGSEWRP